MAGVIFRHDASRWHDTGRHPECIARIEAIEGELAGVPHFYLLFHSKKSAGTLRPFLWQEPLLYAEFRERKLSFVSSKRALIDDLLATKSPLADYFNKQGWGINHYNGRGNAAVFAALRAGLEGRYEPYEYLRGVKGASATIPRKIREAFEVGEGE